jgi:hypothetical protein
VSVLVTLQPCTKMTSNAAMRDILVREGHWTAPLMQMQAIATYKLRRQVQSPC